MRPYRLIPTLLGLLFVGACGSGAAPLTYHVAPTGSDTNSGGQAAPFATLSRARDAVRAATGRSSQGQNAVTSGWQGAEVIVRGGTYYQTSPLSLDGRDSGTSSYRVVYKAFPGESPVISGGVRIPVEAWKPVRDPLLRARLAPSVRDSVRMLDLRSIGIKDLGEPGVPGSRIDLIVGGRRATPAEWPNDSWAAVGSVAGAADPSTLFLAEDRPKRWAPESGQWMHGYWAGDDADSWYRVSGLDRATRKVKLAGSGPQSGVVAGQWLRAVNILEELDQAGEWWVNSVRAQLLLLPADAGALNDVVLSETSSLVVGAGSNWISFVGMRFEAARSHAVDVSGAQGLILEGVTIKNVGGWGVRVVGGASARLARINVSGTGQGGVLLSGGVLATLTECGHVIEGSTVSDFGNVQRVGSPGVSLAGVGTTVSGCTIQDGPQAGLEFTGNGHRIETSIFRRLCRETGSAGAITAVGDWTTRGTVISGNSFETVRHSDLPTWVSGVGEPSGILIKGGTSGITVSGNNFTQAGAGVIIDGGRDNSISGNVFTATTTPVLVRSIQNTPGLEAALRSSLAAASYVTSSTWTTRYPGLSTIVSNNSAAPMGNGIVGNRVTDASWLVNADASARAFIDTTQQNLTSAGTNTSLANLLAYALQSPEAPFSGLVYYVATNGSDGDAGTAGLPFATIARARDAIRAATGRSVAGGNPPSSWKGARVIIRQGVYYSATEIKFDGRDSGTEAHPIEYVAEPGAKVIITGAKPLAAGAWSQVTAENDSYAWSRLPAAATGKVYRLDVNSLGIDKGELGAWMSQHENMLRLIVGDNQKRMSRYPNWPDNNAANWLRVYNSSFVSDGTKGMFSPMSYEVDNTSIRSWNFNQQDGFTHGSLDYPYHIRWQPVGGTTTLSGVRTRLNITTKTVYGAIPGSSDYNNTAQFIAIRNVIEAMTEGSYVWNKTRGFIYYWSSGGAPADARVTVASTLLRLGTESTPNDAANWVTFKNLIVEGARRAGIAADHVRGLRIEECELRNFGWVACVIRDSTRVSIIGGSIHDGASRALTLHGGDEQTLTPAGNIIDGTEIYEIGYDLNAEISTALSTSRGYGSVPSTREGCGLTIRNVHMHDIRDGLISATMAKLVIEDCLFERFLTITGDAGGITGAFRFTQPDNVIRRCTFRNARRLSLHNQSLGATVAIYLDMLWGWTLEDNSFTNLDQAIYAGGKHHTIRRNTFSGCSLGHWGAAIVVLPRQGHVSSTSVPRLALEEDLAAAPLTAVPWSSGFPQLRNYRAGGSLNFLLGYHEETRIVDNVARESGSKLLRIYPQDTQTTYNGYSVGIDMQQKNYPSGSTATPVDGGGSVALQTVSRIAQ